MSSKPKKGPLKQKRLLSRDVEIREAELEDVRYFYAGYRLGAFDENLSPEKDMDPEQFKEWLARYAESATQLYTARVNGSDPLCVGHVSVVLPRLEVHVNWMPWASPRNKLEVIGKFMKEFNDYTVITVVSQKNKGAFFQMRNYGLMKFVGEISGYFEDGSGYVFQGV